jgi:hypothetical protein
MMRAHAGVPLDRVCFLPNSDQIADIIGGRFGAITPVRSMPRLRVVATKLESRLPLQETGGVAGLVAPRGA